MATAYVYDEAHVIAEYEDSGSGYGLARKYVYGPGIDEPIAMILVDAGQEFRYFYHADRLGSVAALSQLNGQVVERYAYDVFGQVQILTSDFQPLASSQYGNAVLFTGRWWSATTGLYHYRFRDYSPDLGRFLQPDPLGYIDGMNLYAYVNNNPLNWIDPWGLRTIWIEILVRDNTGKVDLEKIQQAILRSMRDSGITLEKDTVIFRIRRINNMNDEVGGLGVYRAHRAVPSKGVEKGDILRFRYGLTIEPGAGRYTGRSGENRGVIRSGNVDVSSKPTQGWMRTMLHEAIYHGMLGHLDSSGDDNDFHGSHQDTSQCPDLSGFWKEVRDFLGAE